MYPQWLQQFSAPQSFIEREGSYQAPFPQTVVRRNAQGKYVEVDEYRGKKTPNLHEVTVKTVCAGCNNGWMSALENSVRKPLLKMANPPRPEPHQVHARTKTDLAAWAYKCFLMYDQYRDPQDRVFLDGDFVAFKNTKRPPITSRIYMGITNSPHSTFAMWHETHLLVLDRKMDPQTILATHARNLASSSLGVQGVYFIQQYFRPDIPWTPAARQAIDLSARIAVEATPAYQIWPPNNKQLNWPPQVTSNRQFEDARLALFRVMSTLPALAETVETLD